MTGQIPINLAYEDELSHAVMLKMIESTRRPFLIGTSYSGRGYGYLKKMIKAFNLASRGMPHFVLTDLDSTECAPALLHSWLTVPKHDNLIFRIAVPEVESWIMAARNDFAHFMGVQTRVIPDKVDELTDAKATLIQIARTSRKREICRDIVPRQGSLAKQGPNYNDRLSDFVSTQWNPTTAAINSASLRAAYAAIERFEPTWNT